MLEKLKKKNCLLNWIFETFFDHQKNFKKDIEK